MNVTTHAPAPWVVDREASQIHVVSGRTAVARVMHGRPDGEANARLIAAAPELLEALQRLLNKDSDEHLTPQGVRNLAHAAIAKATGEAA